jgi:C-terminal processing protease CtpA/Prc
VKDSSTAAKAGIEPGDIIISVNRRKIETLAEFKKFDDQKVLLLRIMRGNFYLLVHLRLK